MEELRDIKGLDSIAWYQPAPGWLLLLAGVLLVILLIIRWRQPKPLQTPAIHWKTVATTEFHALKQLDSPRQQLESLAILLRRIAIQRYGRETCAGLNGEAWLQWLQTHDLQQFNWVTEAQILIKLPYMPPDAKIEAQQVDLLIHAVEAWLN